MAPTIHPEAREDEVYVGNGYQALEKDPEGLKDKHPDPWGGVRWKTRRMGDVAYKNNGERLPFHRPIFVQRSELEAAGFDPDKPILE